MYARAASLASAACPARTCRFRLSPASHDHVDAETWLDQLEAAGLDGVVAKRLHVPYLPGSRDGVVKVKRYRTADCIIVGFRRSEKREGEIATALLGLYGDDGKLEFVGHVSGFPDSIRRQLNELLPPLVEPGHISGE